MIKKNLTELLCKELLLKEDELTLDELKIIDICSGIISSLNDDLTEMNKRIYHLEIDLKNKKIIIDDMLLNKE
jgi:hypothetical protein